MAISVVESLGAINGPGLRATKSGMDSVSTHGRPSTITTLGRYQSASSGGDVLLIEGTDTLLIEGTDELLIG